MYVHIHMCMCIYTLRVFVFFYQIGILMYLVPLFSLRTFPFTPHGCLRGESRPVPPLLTQQTRTAALTLLPVAWLSYLTLPCHPDRGGLGHLW